MQVTRSAPRSGPDASDPSGTGEVQKLALATLSCLLLDPLARDLFEQLTCAARTRDASRNRPMSTGDVVSCHQQILQQRIYSLDAGAQKKLSEYEKDRANDKKPPLGERTVLSATAEAEQIMRDPEIKDKEKAVDEVRKKYGMSEDEMKDLVTQRVSKIYDDGKEEIKRFREQREKDFDKSIDSAEKTYGNDSPEVASLKAEKEQLKTGLKSYEKALGQISDAYDDKYPSFWKKVGGVLGKVFNFALDFVKFIPGVGTAIDLGIKAVKGIYNVVTDGWDGLKRTALDLAGSLTGGIVDKLGLGDIAGKVVSIANDVKGYASSGFGVISSLARGDVLGAIGSGAGLGSSIAGTRGAGDVFNAIGDGARTGQQAIRAFNGFASGDLGAGFSSLSRVSTGVGSLTGWDTGDFSSALSSASGVANNARAFAVNPIETSSAILYQRLLGLG